MPQCHQKEDRYKYYREHAREGVKDVVEVEQCKEIGNGDDGDEENRSCQETLPYTTIVKNVSNLESEISTKLKVADIEGCAWQDHVQDEA